ncbi:MAG: hypothetical protein IJK67_06135 [Bacilli bacterium]|nr:hypothetical protein [Bacilli bacterium]
MDKFFYRPTGFQDEEDTKRKEYLDTMDLKSRALKEIDTIDSKPYTMKSFERREELLEIIKECNRKLNSLSIYKPVDSGRAMINNIDFIMDSEELLKLIFDKNSISNSKEKDKRSIQRYLDGKRTNQYKEFMYQESKGKNDVNPDMIQEVIDPTKSSDAFIISDAGVEPENVADVNYRVTLRNSNNLRNEDVLAFIEAFQNEAVKRKIYIRCKVRFEESDGIIFYVDKNNLLEIVKLLEDLKDEKKYGKKVLNAIENFGNPQPFAAILGEDGYYSIAMHGAEPYNTRIKSSLGGGLIHTFNQYMDICLDYVYGILMNKYRNDSSKITVDEFYKELIAYHKKRMGTEEEIPLWMNNRIYNEINSIGLHR